MPGAAPPDPHEAGGCAPGPPRSRGLRTRTPAMPKAAPPDLRPRPPRNRGLRPLVFWGVGVVFGCVDMFFGVDLVLGGVAVDLGVLVLKCFGVL